MTLTPLLARLFGLMIGLLFVLTVFHGVRHTPVYKEHLFQQLLAGNRAQKLGAAARLVDVGGQRQLIRALQDDSTEVRDVANGALWDLWFREGGDQAYDLTVSAVAQIEHSDFDGAMKTLNEVVRRYPDFAEGRNRRATLYWMMERYAESIRDCQMVLELKPEHFGAWQGLAMGQMQLGDFEGAVFSLHRAVRLQPHDEMTVKLLRRCERMLKAAPAHPRVPVVQA